MQVQVMSNKDKEGFFTVVPFGSIDSDTHGDFRDKLAPLLVKSTKGILVDLQNIDYISSAGLGVLFSVKKYLTENKASFLFCNLKPQIKKLFDVVKVLPKDSIFTSVDEADKYFYSIMNQEIRKQTEKK